MNKLQGIIKNVDTEGSISIIKILPSTGIMDTITSIVIDTPSTAGYLRTGEKISILFKETEVILAKELAGAISIQNKLGCKVLSVENGKLLSRVTLDYHGAPIVSVITSNAASQLRIGPGEEVTALIKTNEISIAPDA